MSTAELTFGEYRTARTELGQLCMCLGVWASRVPAGAIEILGDVPDVGDEDNIPIRGVLQSARNHLLIVRELLGERYDNIPAPDKLIRHCDNALKGTPGEGGQTQRPYK
jgi:hypothetical protein